MAFCCCGDNFWYLSNSYPIYGYIERKFEPPCCFSRAGSGCYPPCNETALQDQTGFRKIHVESELKSNIMK